MGLPMIVRVAQRVSDMKVGEVLVAAGNKIICNVLKKYKIRCILTKHSHQSGTDRINEAFQKIKKKKYKIIINLQGDLPYFEKELIIKIISTMKKEDTDIGTAVCDLKSKELNNPNLVKANVLIDKNGFGRALDFNRIVKSKKNNFHHIGVYGFKPRTLEKFVSLKESKKEIKRNLEQMRAIENKMPISIVKVKANPISVDTLEDLKKIRVFFNNRVKKI